MEPYAEYRPLDEIEKTPAQTGLPIFVKLNGVPEFFDCRAREAVSFHRIDLRISAIASSPEIDSIVPFSKSRHRRRISSRQDSFNETLSSKSKVSSNLSARKALDAGGKAIASSANASNDLDMASIIATDLAHGNPLNPAIVFSIPLFFPLRSRAVL
jgi:hypothetical protein